MFITRRGFIVISLLNEKKAVPDCSGTAFSMLLWAGGLS
jgi:hypothetical protein